MPTRLFSDLVDVITPSAPGCPQPVVIEYARRTAIEVCERTSAWRYELADVTLTDGTYSYAYVTPTDTEVHTILKAAVNNAPLGVTTLEQTISRYPEFPTSDAEYRSTPQFFVGFDPDTYMLAPCPDGETTYTLKLIAALKPLTSAAGMEQTVLDDIEDVVMHGTLQRLLTLPERTWSDKELAAYHAKQYAFKVSERRARANLGAGRASVTIKNVPFA